MENSDEVAIFAGDSDMECVSLTGTLRKSLTLFWGKNRKCQDFKTYIYKINQHQPSVFSLHGLAMGRQTFTLWEHEDSTCFC